MISTVLYETKGVITEERFQNMTDIQWMFQYSVIQQQKDEQYETYRAILDTLKHTIQYAGIFSHPDVSLENVVNMLRSDGKTADDFANEATQFILENADKFPEEITVVREQKKKSKVKQGRVDKKLGIITTT